MNVVTLHYRGQQIKVHKVVADNLNLTDGSNITSSVELDNILGANETHSKAINKQLDEKFNRSKYVQP